MKLSRPLNFLVRLISISASFISFFTCNAQEILSRTGINNNEGKKVKVESIVITGNKVTHNYIIRRELNFKEGDSLETSGLNTQLELCRERVYNTTLFVEVKMSAIILTGSGCTINIVVKERWYIFPIPQFQLVARSFNEWVHKYHGSLERVNYGVNFTDNNLTGRRDKLKVSIINGFSQNLSAFYTTPYLDRKLVNGISIGGGYLRTREIAYLTNYNNQQLFYKHNDFVTDSWNVTVAYSIRKAITSRQVFRVRYTVTSIEDSLINIYNPKYFNSQARTKALPDFYYQLYYDDVDNILYPLKGVSAKLLIQKRGLGYSGSINMFSVFGQLDKYYSLGRKWYAGATIQAQIKLPFEQPYINQRALGFEENYLRGLELYVIDGVAYTLSKINFKREILHFTLPGIKGSKTYKKIPFTIYAKAFSDLGYVYAKKVNAGMLNNKFLYTGGFGLDFVTLYDFHIRLEYSFNQIGENGLFLHNGSGL